MVHALTDPQVLGLRMRSQRLAGLRPADAASVVTALCGLQAQSTRPSRLAVRPRSVGVDETAVIRACTIDRSIVRTWVMRGTLHMVAAQDLGWLVALLGPRFASAGRPRRLQLGLDDALCRRALPAIEATLERTGPLTRAELVRQLAMRGVLIDPRGQAPAHLVAYAAQVGLVCRGPDRSDAEPTYVLVRDWVGERPSLEGDAALAELARRYVRAYGPAGPEDLAAWCGLGILDARRGFEAVAGEFEEVETAGGPMRVAGAIDVADAAEQEPTVRLVPDFDTYLLGYRSRRAALDPRFAARIQAGGGWIHAAVLVDGQVVGTWRHRRADDRLEVAVAPFEQLARTVVAGLEAEVADLGRFVGTQAVLRLG